MPIVFQAAVILRGNLNAAAIGQGRLKRVCAGGLYEMGDIVIAVDAGLVEVDPPVAERKAGDEDIVAVGSRKRGWVVLPRLRDSDIQAVDCDAPVGRGVGSARPLQARGNSSARWLPMPIRARGSARGSIRHCSQRPKQRRQGSRARWRGSTMSWARPPGWKSAGTWLSSIVCVATFLCGAILLIPRPPRTPTGPQPPRAGARRAQPRVARVASARQALSIHRPPRRSPRHPRARLGGLFADGGDAGDR